MSIPKTIYTGFTKEGIATHTWTIEPDDVCGLDVVAYIKEKNVLDALVGSMRNPHDKFSSFDLPELHLSGCEFSNRQILSRDCVCDCYERHIFFAGMGTAVKEIQNKIKIQD